ncbi:hypothetical protein JCM8547_006889 [Rhodosporidiobolus lusitaniae]
MCRAHTVLAFAICCSTPSLLEAADAFPHLRPALRFFDLVELRGRKGTLSFAQTRLTNEIFDLIRKHLVSTEIAAARLAIVEPLLCDDCHLLHHNELDQLSWVDLPLDRECERCYEKMWEFQGLEDSERAKRVRTLLSSYGLALPTSFPLRTSRDSSSSGFFTAGSDPQTGTLISLPLNPSPKRSNESGFVAVEAECGGDWAPDEQAVVSLSFSTPPDATERFKKLIKLFQLEPIEASDGLLAVEGIEPPEGFKKKVRRKKRFKKIKVEEVAPKWKLFSTFKSTSSPSSRLRGSTNPIKGLTPSPPARCAAPSTFSATASKSSLPPSSPLPRRTPTSPPTLDLVELRKRGTLETSEKGEALERTPVEVWEMVKDELIKVAVEEAMKALVEEFLVSRCRLGKWERNKLKHVTWEAVHCDFTCEECLSERTPDWEEVWQGRRLEHVSRLLSLFHLDLITDKMVFPGSSNSRWNNSAFLSASFLSLPAQLIGNPHTTSSYYSDVGRGLDETSEDTVVDISLGIPPNSASRFKRLIKTYSLEFVKVENEPSQEHRNEVMRAEEQKTKFRATNLQKEPVVWRLFCACDTLY